MDKEGFKRLHNSELRKKSTETIGYDFLHMYVNLNLFADYIISQSNSGIMAFQAIKIWQKGFE